MYNNINKQLGILVEQRKLCVEELAKPFPDEPEFASQMKAILEMQIDEGRRFYLPIIKK